MSEKSELQSLVDETITSKEEESESIEDYYKDIIYGVYDDAYENSIANSKNGEEEEGYFFFFYYFSRLILVEQYSNTSDSFSFRRTSSSASSSSSEDISNRLRSL